MSLLEPKFTSMNAKIRSISAIHEIFPGGEDVNSLDSARLALVDARDILLEIRKEILDKAERAGNRPLDPQAKKQARQKKSHNAWRNATNKVTAVQQFKRAGTLRRSKNVHSHGSVGTDFASNSASNGKKLFRTSLSRLDDLLDNTSSNFTASSPKNNNFTASSPKVTRLARRSSSEELLMEEATVPLSEEQQSMAESGKLILTRELARTNSERMIIKEVSDSDLSLLDKGNVTVYSEKKKKAIELPSSEAAKSALRTEHSIESIINKKFESAPAAPYDAYGIVKSLEKRASEGSTGYPVNSDPRRPSLAPGMKVLQSLMKDNVAHDTNIPLLALSTAIKRGRETDAVALIRAKANVNERSAQSATPLILAVQHANKFKETGEALVSVLLEARADAMLQDSTGDTALHYAFLNGRDHLVNTLLAGGAMNCLDIRNNAGQAPMDLTLQSDSDSEVEFTMIEECQKDREERCRRLLEEKADVNAKDEKGFTGLMYVVKNDNVGMAEMLLDFNADPNIRSNKKSTALHFAYQIENASMIKLLLLRGASARRKNKDGKTPVDLTNKTFLKKLAKQTKSPKRRQRGLRTPTEP